MPESMTDNQAKGGNSPGDKTCDYIIIGAGSAASVTPDWICDEGRIVYITESNSHTRISRKDPVIKPCSIS